jgi:N utilization substance protein B
MARRTRAREVALQALYQLDLNPDGSLDQLGRFLAARLQEEELREFAKSLVLGVRRNQAELDASLQQTAANWSLRRMAATDRNLLRLAAFEMRYGETPGRVAIDEAVELAKRFGTAQSPAFVNGILDKFLDKEPNTPPATPSG